MRMRSILASIQGVYVDDRIVTSITPVSRATEPAVSHPPLAGCVP